MPEPVGTIKGVRQQTKINLDEVVLPEPTRSSAVSYLGTSPNNKVG